MVLVVLSYTYKAGLVRKQFSEVGFQFAIIWSSGSYVDFFTNIMVMSSLLFLLIDAVPHASLSIFTWSP